MVGRRHPWVRYEFVRLAERGGSAGAVPARSRRPPRTSGSAATRRRERPASPIGRAAHAVTPPDRGGARAGRPRDPRGPPGEAAPYARCCSIGTAARCPARAPHGDPTAASPLPVPSATGNVRILAMTSRWTRVPTGAGRCDHRRRLALRHRPSGMTVQERLRPSSASMACERLLMEATAHPRTPLTVWLCASASG